MISRTLLLDDFLWALDHSTRAFRVRQSRPGDNPQVRAVESYITVVPLDGTERIILLPQCRLFPGPWEDSDRYAGARLNTIVMASAARAGVVRPEPDAVRLGHDFGQWCAELFRGERLARRVHCGSRAEAWSEVLRQEKAGLRRLPNSGDCLFNGGAA